MSDLVRSIDPGTSNLGLCDFCPSQNKIVRWEVFTAATIHSLFAQLDARPFTGKVVIERQSKKSMKMLSVMHYLQAYYTLKGSTVVIVSPVNKLKGTGQENAGKANYRARKKAAIALATEWLAHHQQDPAIIACFRSTKKKDDFSDSLLQMLAFLKRPMSVEITLPTTDNTRIVCRKPTLHQEQTGRYSRSNVKHIITKDWHCQTETDLLERLNSDKKVARSVQRHFGGVTRCVELFASGLLS